MLHKGWSFFLERSDCLRIYGALCICIIQTGAWNSHSWRSSQNFVHSEFLFFVKCIRKSELGRSRAHFVFIFFSLSVNHNLEIEVGKQVEVGSWWSSKNFQVQEGIEVAAYENIRGDESINLFQILGDQVPPEVVSNLQAQVESIGKQ